jgi:starvation-inducible DNA-binding protein
MDFPTPEVSDGFGPVEVDKLSSALNSLLADCFALYLKTKNFHWHMTGPHFRDWHLMLDEQATQIYGITDDIAERVRKIGGTTIKSIGQIARLQRIQDSDEPGLAPDAMLSELLTDNRTLITQLRAVHTVCEFANDFASTAMIEVWIDEAERRAWFLFEATR